MHKNLSKNNCSTTCKNHTSAIIMNDECHETNKAKKARNYQPPSKKQNHTSMPKLSFTYTFPTIR